VSRARWRSITRSCCSLLDNEKLLLVDHQPEGRRLSQAAILKDVQRHPARTPCCTSTCSACSTTRRSASPFRCTSRGEAGSPGVKTQGGVVSHLRNDVEVSCLPKDLPEFIEVDLSGVDLNQMVHLADLPVPEGVEIPELTHGRNSPVASIHHARAQEEAEAPAAEAAAAGATAAAPAAAAKPAGEPKKEGKK
jgi:large subunit ribosomal protein L25